ncbi:MAG: D-glycerate dehydrogenase [Syntrophus sp. (in: bacteria)]|nr:D-glycerate dehydrogenase [Syntrophus sp. (in: bacteria)]
MVKPTLFITQPVEASALRKLTALMEVEVHPDATKTISKESLINGVREKDYLFCRLGDQIDADVIGANKNLKLIATMATGSGGIDVNTATKLKIPVIGRDISNQKEGYSGIVEETADLTWVLLMAVARRILEGDRLVRSGVFPGPHSMCLLGSGVYGKSIGIVGMGKIGRAVSRRARAFGMTIFYYSRKRHPDVEEGFAAAYLSFEELLQTVDFVCMLPQYSAETHHMIGEKQLSLMRPTAFLINTSRGPVVDQEALVKALRMKKIAGAALDVFEGEPHPVLPKELIAMPNCVLTPHMGSAVAEKREIMVNEIADEIIAFSQGKAPSHPFNPEVLGRK